MATRGSAMQRAAPIAFGVACLLFLALLVEVMIGMGLINRFIVPYPSEIAQSFERIILEEDVGRRFLQTCGEALVATLLLVVVGISLGVLLHRVKLLRLATQTWIAALASAPLVLMYPLFLVLFGRSIWTITMISF